MTLGLRDIPNIISAVRIALVIPVAYAIGCQQYPLALFLFVFAGVSDAIDGYLARHYDWHTPLGAMLDPIADKLLLVTSYLMIGWTGLVPLWLVVAVILRDVVIFSGAVMYHHWFEPFRGEPLLVGKLNTFLQICLVIAVLFNAWQFLLSEPLINGLTLATLCITVVSGCSYVLLWGLRACRHQRGGTGHRKS